MCLVIKIIDYAPAFKSNEGIVLSSKKGDSPFAPHLDSDRVKNAIQLLSAAKVEENRNEPRRKHQKRDSDPSNPFGHRFQSRKENDHEHHLKFDKAADYPHLRVGETEMLFYNLDVLK